MPQEFYAELIDRLARVRARRERVDLSLGLVRSLIAILGILSLAVAIEAVFHLSITGRTVLFYNGLAIVIAASAYFLFRPLAIRLGIKPKLSDDELAARIGKYYPTVSDRLLNTLQLARPLFTKASALLGSPSLALAAFNTTYEPTRTLDFEAIVEERTLKRALLFLLIECLVFGGAFFGASNEMASAGSRLYHFRTFYQKPAPFVFQVSPGDVRLMRGDSLHITVTTRGEQLAHIILHIREEGQKEFDTIGIAASVGSDQSRKTTKNTETAFHYDLRVQHPLEYYAEAEEIESPQSVVSVMDHPTIRSLSVTVAPPSYTREKPQRLNENFGDITGVTGTRAEFRILSSKPLKSARLIFQPAHTDSASARPNATPAVQSYDLTTDDTVAKGSVTFMQSGSYHLELLDTESIASEHPIEYSVSITRDEDPTIVLVEPTDRADLPNNLRLEMLAHIHDDFGFRGVRLGYRLTKSKYNQPEKDYHWLDVPLANYNTQDLDVPYIWNLTPMELAPEDEIGYVLEVSDNDAVTGPKKARTPEFTVRYPSVKEIFDRANEEESHAEKNLNEIKQDATELQKKVDEAVNEMRQTKSANMAKEQQEFSKQKDLQQMLEQQKELNNRVEDVAKQLDQMTQQLDKQQALSPETMEKYQELQKLFKEINSPELKKAMDQLQQAMQNVDPKQLEAAMKNMQFNEQNFKKSIERTTNILKRIQLEQKIDEMTKRSGELAKQEDRASDAAKNAQQNPQSNSPQSKAEQARQQEDAKKELDRLKKEAEQLASDMKKLPEKMQAPEEMQSAEEALADPSTQQSMEDAEQADQQGDMDRASQRSQDASKGMKAAQRKLQRLKQKLSESEKQRTMRELRQIRDELNRLSKQEENLKNAAKQAQPNSNVFRDLADQQSETKDELGQTASKAMDLAQRSTTVTPEMGEEMGKAFASMQHATEQMTDRDQSGAGNSSEAAMAALNQAAASTQQAMEGMGKGKGQGMGQGEGDQEGENPGGQQPGGEGEGDDGPGGQGQGSAMQQFLSSIQKLTAQQKEMNDMMAGMQGKSGAASAEKQMMEQQSQLAKLAARQQAAQKSIQELEQQQRESQMGNKLAADELKNISDQMQEVISDMKSNGVRPETIQRQERILSKLLEAQRSMHERDKEPERESKPGENVARQSPRELQLDASQSRQQIQDELTRTRESGYSKDYEALIRKYFDAMEKENAK